MRETLPWGGHHLYDAVVARRLQRFYDRVARRRPEADAILDLGCGAGHLTAALARHHPDADVLGMDLDPVQVRLARRAHDHVSPLRFAEGASHAIPLGDGERDWIVSAATYHHWRDPPRALGEVHRVLRPGGEFWLIEGAGDMTRQELEAWTGRRAPPGLTPWVRWVFRSHGYTGAALRRDVLPALEQSPFSPAHVAREDGWWIVRLRK